MSSAYALTPDRFFAKAAPSVWRVFAYDAKGAPLTIGSAVVTAARFPAGAADYLRALELRRALLMKRFDAFAEIVRLTQPAVAMALEFDGDRERRVLGIIQ